MAALFKVDKPSTFLKFSHKFWTLDVKYMRFHEQMVRIPDWNYFNLSCKNKLPSKSYYFRDKVSEERRTLRTHRNTSERMNQIRRTVCNINTTRDIRINPLTPESNTSAQRCLTRFFTGDFASWTVHFFNICIKTKNATNIHLVY
jgi:hypothetical protein